VGIDLFWSEIFHKILKEESDFLQYKRAIGLCAYNLKSTKKSAE